MGLDRPIPRFSPIECVLQLFQNRRKSSWQSTTVVAHISTQQTSRGGGRNPLIKRCLPRLPPGGMDGLVVRGMCPAEPRDFIVRSLYCSAALERNVVSLRSFGPDLEAVAVSIQLINVSVFQLQGQSGTNLCVSFSSVID